MTQARRVLIAEARFYEDLANDLAAGAGAVLTAARVTFERIAVPGCFELPATIRMAIGDDPDKAPWQGVIALGCVIRGETDHYDHICREVSRALMDLSVACRLPLGFGVLTCATYAQAKVRAAVEGKNKGADAAHACLRMMEVRHRLVAAPA
ncbi:MAG: 6,7-dimethyl-8-ribityllumazine synthase [Rhodospirillales bacterium]|nr:6,7-dimethyl-8-ribityllumazine synthase [Rhodospirillales bacterium]